MNRKISLLPTAVHSRTSVGSLSPPRLSCAVQLKCPVIHSTYSPYLQDDIPVNSLHSVPSIRSRSSASSGKKKKNEALLCQSHSTNCNTLLFVMQEYYTTFIVKKKKKERR